MFVERVCSGIRVYVENESDLVAAIRALSTAEDNAIEHLIPTQEVLTRAMQTVLESPGGKLFKALYYIGGKGTDCQLKEKVGYDDNRALAGSFAGASKILKRYGLSRDKFIRKSHSNEPNCEYSYEFTDEGSKIMALAMPTV